MTSNFENNLPQEGTQLVGESLTENSSVWPTDSGGAKTSSRDETAVGGLAADITSPKNNEDGNPFQRSKRLARSPPEKMGNPVQKRSRSSPPKITLDAVKNDFINLGEKINELVDMLKDGKRRSIHQPMRDLIDTIGVLYENAASQRMYATRERAKENVKLDKALQTSPTVSSTLKKTGNTQVNAQKTKRPTDPSTGKQGRSTEQTDRGLKQIVEHTAKARDKTSEKTDSDWIKVKKKERKKNKKKKTKPKRPKPDAIIVAAKGELSYAEILRQVKADPKMRDLSDAVSKIRRTQKGELLFQLKEAGEKTDKMKTTIEEVLGEQATAHSLKQRLVVEIKDIDEVTSKEEIYAEIKSQCKVELQPTDIQSLRKGYGGTQTAKVYASAEIANTLLEIGKIKIGWVVCRIREQKTAPLIKCFRCLEFGHLAKHCKSEHDRSKRCRRCGTEGHLAKECTKDPKCMFCNGEGSVDAGHIAGGSKCPLFRKALTSLNNKL